MKILTEKRYMQHHVHCSIITLAKIWKQPMFTDKRMHKEKEKQQHIYGDFPDGPMAKTTCSQSREPGFDPWS